jgi:hypothetical protein
MIADEKLFNGLGQYTVSEVLNRLHVRRGILPQATAADVLQSEANRNAILGAPLLLDQERSLFINANHFDPANFGPKQKRMRQEFRFNFLKVLNLKLPDRSSYLLVVVPTKEV